MVGYSIEYLVEGVLGLFGFLIVIGLLLGLIVCVPVYFYGRHVGKEQVYKECIERKFMKIEYDVKDGSKHMVWKEVK